VVRHALDVSRKTGGAFDVTVSPLIELWGFYSGSTRLPDEAEIRACLEKVGYPYLHIQDGRLEKRRPDVRIDLGAIAKGYNIGEAVKVLREQGVTSALVDAGGDVYALGKKGRQFWHVGIKGPREKKVLGYVDAENLAVVGSGDYERYFTVNEKRYHHIFDPRTGYPSEALSSITLIGPDPMAADAWATALFVLGPEKGLATVEGIPGLEVLMVTAGGDMILSSGLREQLKPLPKTP
jgi:thiamine biosynthesis lipoprotein